MQLRLLTTLLLLAATPALAQQRVLVKISAGTGFVVNRNGDVVTNAHVLRNCQSITVHTAAGDVPAQLVATDTARDLAVIRAPAAARDGVASLRWNIADLNLGDEVVVMGYPGQSGIAGQYQFKKTTVTSLAGPTGEPQWIQLASVAEHGNSGGPVLDGAGNVIAVISGNALTYRTLTSENGTTLGEPEFVGKTDIAVTLPMLQVFLRAHQIPFFESSSGLVTRADDYLANRARGFILPIRCYLGPQAQ